MGIVPDTPGLQSLAEGKNYKQDTPDALREARNAYLRTNPAEYSFQVQLNTGLEEMPVEDANKEWPEESSRHREVRG